MAKIKEFELYLIRLTETLEVDNDEKVELIQEWNQHLNDLFNNYTQKGFPENEAIDLSLKQFGDINFLGEEFKKGFPNPRKMKILKEFYIWLLCLVGSSIGPLLFINAHYSLTFVIIPFIIILICSMFYHLIINRLNASLIWILGIITLYGSFLFITIQMNSIGYLVSQVTTISFEGNGLFTISSIHILWILFILISITSNSSKVSSFTNILKSTFQFWAMILFALILVKTEILTSSSEAKVFILNIFLLYGFLQQVINPRFVFIAKNKIQYWMKRSYIKNNNLYQHHLTQLKKN